MLQLSSWFPVYLLAVLTKGKGDPTWLLIRGQAGTR
jgi:hypothetical protein